MADESGQVVQPPSYAVGVAALVEEAQHVPQVGADQVQRRPAAELVVHPAQDPDGVTDPFGEQDSEGDGGFDGALEAWAY